MGWFDEQIEYRKQQESKMLSDSYEKLHLTLTGRKSGQYYAEGADVNDALEQLLKYFGIRDRKIPASLKEFEEKLDYLLTASDIMFRKVTLEPGWHKDAMGVMITSLKENGSVITVMRDAAGAYRYIDPKTGRSIPVTRQEEKKIESEAYCFYRPLPLRKITLQDLAEQFMLSPGYLSTLINKYTGSSLPYLLDQARLRRAAQLLLSQPELPIAEVARLTGYSAVRRLYNAFQKRLGCTPGEFRERYGDD